MQASYAVLPATSYPKTVEGMYYAIIELTPIQFKQLLVTSQSQARKWDMLSQHALPNQSPGKLDMLSQYAVMTNHKSGKSDMLSQHA